MTDPLGLTLDRELPHPPETVWRALTEPHLIEAWLMRTDFAPEVGSAFRLTADWGAIDGTVLAADPPRMLRYTWVSMGLDSTVTWTLTPSGSGTHLRVEQTGFTRDNLPAFNGAKAGWPRFLGNLERVLGESA